jgi:4-amino-4-deoxy-L-arabinose transferase-like glycosyltransferase
VTAPTARAETRRDLLVVAIVAFVFFSLALGAKDLWNPNEPIYGQAVVEMVERGDWLVPTVNDLVFAEKPILYFWMALISTKTLGGVNELTLRLPSALAGSIATALLYLLVVPYAGRRRARLAVALFVTIFVVFTASRTVQMDILVTATSLGVVLAVTRVLDHDLSPYRGWALAGLAAGLGFLAKGPVGWICPGIPLFLYIVFTRRFRALWTPAVGVGAAVCVVVAAPWIVLLLARGETEFIAEVLFRQNFTRFVEAWDHAAPWWYYLQYFWIDMAPWSWFVPLAIALPGRDEDERRLDLLAWLVIVGIIAFFSLSDSKRSAYILPIAPAVAVLASGVAERLLDGRLSRARTRACLTILAGCAVLLLAGGIYLEVRVVPEQADLVSEARALAVLLVVGSLAVLGGLLARAHSRLAVPTAFFSLVLVLYLLIGVAILPAADIHKSARPFARKVAGVVSDDERIASFKFWRWRSEYRFYLGRPVPNIRTPEALEEYWERPERVFLIVEGDKIDRARGVVGDTPALLHDHVGSREVYLLSNRGRPPNRGFGDTLPSPKRE